ncbi:sugar transport protein 3 [Dorcoceras hygrometricum]|uniref:Sugar transport protein 3 n=1 Tax=Dorcoceras hygrometricum TaxID=472368 RepID=A0A2Z7ARL7_9LAMI|nr:sugar transport protein 3 [Dorcoceras hygrometricum]
MTSAVKSSFSRKLSADEEKSERGSDVVWRISRWISADDVIGDVIRFSRWLEIAQEKRRRRGGNSAESYCAKNQQVATVLPVESLFVSTVATLPVVVKSSRWKRRSRRSEEDQPVARFQSKDLKIQQKRKAIEEDQQRSS